ncbi:MFS transporter (plasmid) [Pantoea agglomerans]|uniref:MFS transporter n=1 Tax=Enterobacter agglomerans TaxID=549 RepID=UPI0013B7D446|nr:MFS transporter [Pantoea agglomerans]NEG87930.1 MFS transporter [Pantoea agglomerans]NEH10014.1 MFS transporter [Pantoea agglomerans]
MNWLKIKDFRTLLASLFISKLGDYVYEVVFVFIVLENTHNNYLLAGCVYFFRFIPFLFFGPAGGWMADNWRIKCSVILSLADKPWVLMFNTLTYPISIVILCTFSENSQNKTSAFRLKQVYQENLSCIKSLFQEAPGFFIAIFGSSVCILFTGSLLRFIIPAVAVSQGNGEIFTSWIFSLMAAGTITGGLIYGRFAINISPLNVMRNWFFYGILLVLMSFIALYSLEALLPVAFVLGMSGAFVDISLVTLIQSWSFAENTGKTFGTFSTLANTAKALSGLLSGLAAAASLMVVFAGMSSLIVLTGIISMACLPDKKQKNISGSNESDSSI